MFNKKLFLCLIAAMLTNLAYAAQKPILNIQQWLTTSGTPVYFVAEKNLPMVDIAIVFDAGSDRDANRPGLANFTGIMLNQGTFTLNANQVANRFDTLGAIFNVNTSKDFTMVHLRSLTKPLILKTALMLFTKVLTTSSFPEPAFQRRKVNLTQAILQQQQQPQTLANQALFANIYGNFPYAHPVMGNKTSVENITRKSLVAFYKKYYVSNNAIIAIVGNISKMAAKTMANNLTAALPKGHKAPTLKTASNSRLKIVYVPFPSTQNYIRIGMVSIKKTSPNYLPFLVANYTLGGGMISRLFATVRETYGLSYGIYSQLSPLAYGGLFSISLQTKNDTSKQALAVTHKVLDTFIGTGITEKELMNAKKYLIGSFPLRLDSNQKILAALISIGFYHLPVDYLNTYTSKINALTLSKVNQIIKTYFNPQHMVTIVVGKVPTSHAK